jgi:gas vesicle protein
MKSSRLLLFPLIFSMLFAPACGKKTQDKAVVAEVNGSPILLSEFKKELSFRENQKNSPRATSAAVKDQLNTMIDRQLMIQEAIKMGLSEDERFAQTIKRYWEQTLIRDLIEAKSREWEKKLTVTEEEISRAYARMHYRIVIRAARASDRGSAEELAAKLRRGEPVEHEERVGPVFYDDVKQTPLEHAFDMQAGETGVFPAAPEFIVLLVEKKQALNLPPLKGLHDQIAQALLERKRQEALNEWVDSLKRSSKISIDKKMAEAAYAD